VLNKPLITVLMSVYNSQDTISFAIESILNQTFSDFEFIIINDGSSDNTLSILNNYSKKDKRIRIIDQMNKGLTRSLNIGIRLAKGKYIARQDDDDLSLPQRLEKEVQLLEKYDEIVLVGTNQYEVKNNNESLGRYYDDESINKIVYIYNPIAHTSAMFRKDKFIEVGLYNESFTTSQDFEAWMRLAEVGKITMIDEPLVKRHITENSITSKKKNIQCLNSIKARFMHLNSGLSWALRASIYQCITTNLPYFIIKLKRKLFN